MQESVVQSGSELHFRLAQELQDRHQHSRRYYDKNL